MSKSTRIEFKTLDGTTLRGDFYAPLNPKGPAIVMSQGLTLLKEHFLSPFIDRFLSQGWSVLAYDHRGFGSSDGLPRHEVNPLVQAEDMHDAVSAAARQPGVDPRKVAIWGTGHAGGVVMLAAVDPRIAAAISHAPFFSGQRDVADFPAGILERAWRERENKTAAGNAEPSYVPAFPTSLENARGEGERTFKYGEAVWSLIEAIKPVSDAAGTPWFNGMTLQSFYHLSRVEAWMSLPRVMAPYLYVVSEDDPFSAPVEAHRKAFAGLGANGQLATVPMPAVDDFDAVLAPAADAMVAFLRATF